MNVNQMKKMIPDIFEDIKKRVYDTIGRKRAGLMLGLSEIGIYRGFYIGAYHILTSNYIVLNKTPLHVLKDKSEDLVYAYIYHLLLHEYIHTLGVADELICRQLTYEISNENFGKDSMITFLAGGGFKKLFPEIIHAPIDFGAKIDKRIELVRGFDRSSCNYYS
jgi:predicted Zn-dependent protease with MMP-like domain